MEPFYSVSEYYKKLFGEKTYKISLNTGMTCPNRDGRVGVGGCIFCSEGGSGDFSPSPALSISEQIDNAIGLVENKYSGQSYIAYFQAFTNTYAPVEKLREYFTAAVMDKRIRGMSIATRPDCLEAEKIRLLMELNKIKPVWVELGLQTIRDDTARLINRGYSLSVFEDALQRLNGAGIPVIVHVILGLPGEGLTDYIKTAEYLAKRQISGVKLQLLHVLKNTVLEKMYEKGEFNTLTMEEYLEGVTAIIERLPKDMVIHRVTGDGPRSLLVAPLWSLDKKRVLNALHRHFKDENTWQGRLYIKENNNGT